MISPHILVVGSDPVIMRSVTAMLAETSCRAEETAIGADAVAKMHCNPPPDLVLLELGNGSDAGLQVLQEIRTTRTELAIVVLSASGNTRQVAEAIRLGARDYLTVPLQEIELQQVLLRCLGPKLSTNGATDSREIIEHLGEDVFFVAASPAMRKVRIQADLLANINVPVLILGESGTGKEVTAHLIHKLSSRSQQRFLKVNCAALPAELLESELFGYERGAFTGAMRTKPGKFELCNEGTILLDEVAEIPPNLQAKLLHVLQDKQFFRLGGETMIDVDVRVLAATNIDVHEAIVDRTFREDLYYRLSAFTIFLPPLRERQVEIPVLLRHFMARLAAQYSLPPVQFSPALSEACLRYPWPGNLRELENFVKRYLVMGDEAMAMAELQANWRQNQIVKELPPVPIAPRSEVTPTNGEAHGAQSNSVLRTLKNETELHAISRALQETHWNRKRAARLLNISYRGLLYKIRQHGITRATGAVLPPFLRDREIGQ
ncbi:MAG TPA: sigma-54 dependent transcriptional regulator [Terriglobales bacterium]|nr:sigma-54 dependent transcriptional regulator [Terriglobales bacterium]